MKAKHVFLTLGLSLAMGLGVATSLVVGQELAPAKAANTTVYCKMEYSWWTKDGAAVGIYAWKNDTGKTPKVAWPGERMAAVSGDPGVWSFEIDTATYPNVIFTRVNGGTGAVSDYGAKTKDLTFPTDSKNLFTISSSSEVWGDPGCEGNWTEYTPPVKPTAMTYSINDGAAVPMVDNGDDKQFTTSSPVSVSKGDVITFTKDSNPYVVAPKDDDLLTNVYLDGADLTFAVDYSGPLYVDYTIGKLWAGQFASGYYFLGDDISWNVKLGIPALKEADKNVYYVENVTVTNDSKVKCIYIPSDSTTVTYLDANAEKISSNTQVELNVGGEYNNDLIIEGNAEGTSSGLYNIYYDADNYWYSVEDQNWSEPVYTVFYLGESREISFNHDNEYMTAVLDVIAGQQVTVLKNGAPDDEYEPRLVSNNNIDENGYVLCDAEDVRIYIDKVAKDIFVGGLGEPGGYHIRRSNASGKELIHMTHGDEYEGFDQYFTDFEYFEADDVLEFINMDLGAALPVVFSIGKINTGGLYEKFGVVGGKIKCLTSCSCKVYMKLKFEADEVYFGEVEEYIYDATEFAKKFNTNIEAVCNAIKEAGAQEALESAWGLLATEYTDDLSGEAKTYIKSDSALSIPAISAFHAKYARVYTKRAQGMGWDLSDFLGKYSGSNYNIKPVVRNNNVLVITLISVSTLVASGALVLFLLKKKKYSK